MRVTTWYCDGCGKTVDDGRELDGFVVQDIGRNFPGGEGFELCDGCAGRFRRAVCEAQLGRVNNPRPNQVKA